MSSLAFPPISHKHPSAGNKNYPLQALSGVDLQNQIDAIQPQVDAIQPGHNFIEVVSPALGTILSSRQFTFVCRTMRKHGVDPSPFPEVKINGTIVPTSSMTLLPDSSICEIVVDLALSEGGNTIALSSNNAYFLETEVVYQINTPPLFGAFSVSYPAGQSAVKAFDTFTIDLGITGAFTDVLYESTSFTITDPTVYSATKTLQYTSALGVFQDSGTNLTVTATNTANSTITTQQYLIQIQDIAVTGSITVQPNHQGSYLVSPHLSAGTHNVRVSTDYPLSSAPTLSVPEGTLTSFVGSGTLWEAQHVITAGGSLSGQGDYTGTLYSSSLKGSSILEDSLFYWDKESPVIISATLDITNWWITDGVILLTIQIADAFTQFTGTVDLSPFGLSSVFPLIQSSSTFLKAQFQPVQADVALTAIQGIISDLAGNSISFTGSSLQTHAYHVSPETLFFPPYTNTSSVLSNAQTFTVDANSIVWFSEGSEARLSNNYALVHGVDYTVSGGNQIVLDSIRFTDEIAANALGLLTVDVYEN